MQLQLTNQELQALANIIEARDEELRSGGPDAQDADAKRALEHERRVLNNLEDQVIERDLHFTSDELDLLGELVVRRQAELEKTMYLPTTNALQSQAEQELLKQIRDRFAETCAMF